MLSGPVCRILVLFLWASDVFHLFFRLAISICQHFQPIRLPCIFRLRICPALPVLPPDVSIRRFHLSTALMLCFRLPALLGLSSTLFVWFSGILTGNFTISIFSPSSHFFFFFEVCRVMPSRNNIRNFPVFCYFWNTLSLSKCTGSSSTHALAWTL